MVGTGDGIAFFGAFAAAAAAATAALTTRVGLSVVFGFLAAMRVLLALAGAVIAAVAAALG